MTAHTLEAPKGWPSPSAVDYTAPFDATDLATLRAAGNEVWAGRCVHIENDGALKYGVTGRQMPLFVFQNSDDPDVENPGGSASTDPHVWIAVAPTGNLNCFVAAGAYELATTEFDDTQAYNPNDLLYAATGTTNATSGVLTNAGIGGAFWPAIAGVGVVSRGRTAAGVISANTIYPAKGENSHRVQELFFWPEYLPGMNGLTEPTWA
jgi:hypothetical protein